jgi:hypothetical protein
VSYVTLLATWNITDATTGTANDTRTTLHFALPDGPELGALISCFEPESRPDVPAGTDSATWDLTFLKCGLSWSVRSATIDYTSALVNVSDADGQCACMSYRSSEASTRTSLLHGLASTASTQNSVGYNWTALACILALLKGSMLTSVAYSGHSSCRGGPSIQTPVHPSDKTTRLIT